MYVDVVRAFSSRNCVVRRVDMPVVFAVDFETVPAFMAAGRLPARVALDVRGFDWQRKAFRVSEASPSVFISPP